MVDASPGKRCNARPVIERWASACPCLDKRTRSASLTWLADFGAKQGAPGSRRGRPQLSLGQGPCTDTTKAPHCWLQLRGHPDLGLPWRRDVVGQRLPDSPVGGPRAYPSRPGSKLLHTVTALSPRTSPPSTSPLLPPNTVSNTANLQGGPDQTGSTGPRPVVSGATADRHGGARSD